MIQIDNNEIMCTIDHALLIKKMLLFLVLTYNYKTKNLFCMVSYVNLLKTKKNKKKNKWYFSDY